MEKGQEYQVVNYSDIESGVLDGGLINISVVDVAQPRSGPSHYCPLDFRFVWYTIITGAICLLGLTGNTLSILILQKDGGNKVANLLLQALAVADNALLLTSFFMLSIVWGGLEYFNATDVVSLLHPYLRVYVQPIGYMTKTSAIWMTVLLAINRYVVIKKPFEAARICTLCKARIQVLGVLVFSVLCNIPRFFQNRVIRDKTGQVSFEESSVGKGSLFHIIYTNVLYTTLVIILPLIVLVFMNVSLILELKTIHNQRKELTVQNPRPSDQNITLVMCIIIVIFIACHTPDRILQGIKSFLGNDWWTHSCYLSAVCNLLIVVNSSINFLIYYFLRKRFRKLLFQTLCATFSGQPTMENSRKETTQAIEKRRPTITLHRLSNSIAQLLNKQVETNDNKNAQVGSRARTQSLGDLDDMCGKDGLCNKSQSFRSLLEMATVNDQHYCGPNV